jgi:hypothetical protein
MTLYAKWIIGVYTVHFEGNGGSDTPDQAVNYQALAVYPPIPEKEGALFLRWRREITVENAESEDEEETEEAETEFVEFDFSTPITGDITLYAEWHEGASE